jgi:hypothetical protein
MATFRPSQERCVRSLSPPTSSLDSSTGRLSRRAVRAAAPFNLTQFTIAVSPPSAPTPARQHFRSFRYTSNTVMIEFAPFEPARYTRSSLVWRCKGRRNLESRSSGADGSRFVKIPPMETPLTPLEFARRARRLYGAREAVVDGALRLTYEQFFDRADRWSDAPTRIGSSSRSTPSRRSERSSSRSTSD